MVKSKEQKVKRQKEKGKSEAVLYRYLSKNKGTKNNIPL
jgi:hypothetical protein